MEEYHTYCVGEDGIWVHNADYKNLRIPKNTQRKAKKLSPEAKSVYEKALDALEKGDLRGLNDHGLTGNRSGQRAIDLIGIGKGRGAGRIIYQVIDGVIEIIGIIDILTDHKY